MRGLVFVACFGLLLLIGCQKPDGYQYDKGQWYWVWPDTLGGPGEKDFLKVDSDSFEVLGDDFARDRSQVFWKGRLIEHADSASFNIVSDSEYYPFAKDKDSVFFRRFLVEGADPDTFRIIEGAYGADSNTVYGGTVPIAGARVNSFQVVLIYGVKQCDVELADHYFGEPIDADCIAMAWSRDAENYYYGPVKVQDVDYPTFKVLNAYEAEDKFGKFEGYLRVEEAAKALKAWKKKYNH